MKAALRTVFSHIKDAYLIHDDLIVTTNSQKEHVNVIEEVMHAISKAVLTFNLKKGQFGCKTISFWGMIYGADGVRPDLSKGEALNYVTRSQNRSELISFLCVVQSNAGFIPNFFQR